MKTALFDFELPESLIADMPANPRDSARMLVVSDSLLDQHIPDLLSHLRAGDVMVFNDTRVIPARLMGKRGDAKIEVLLHKLVTPAKAGVYSRIDSRLRGNDEPLWQCFAKPAKKLKVGDEIVFAEDFSATVIDKHEDGQVVLSFAESGSAFHAKLAQYGSMPLPPYIEKKRKSAPTRASGASLPLEGEGQGGGDCSNYQTVYARTEAASVAAPTAGLHFTPELLARIDALGVKRVHVTLHVGGGTFLPVKSDDTSKHVMHSEYAELSQEAADAINARTGRVIAVGTTSLRTLESATDEQGITHPMNRETDIFITPGYQFRCVDVLMTNFHLPKSTLFMLVSAFCGLDKMQAAYAHAIAAQYRFYSYGDACLLYRSRHSADFL